MKSLNFGNWCNGEVSKSAKILLSKSIFYVKNHRNLSDLFYIEEYKSRSIVILYPSLENSTTGIVYPYFENILM